jgi:hypothetical protein
LRRPSSSIHSGLPGKFAMQEILEAFGRGQFVETAPVASAFRLLQLRPDGRQIQRIAH